MKYYSTGFFPVTLFTAFLLILGVGIAHADSVNADFEIPTYITGNINGQDGWKKTGAFDVEVATNTFGFASFGGQSLRMSDAITSGSFGDQAFAKPLTDAVGEADSTDGAFARGTLQSHFEMQFDIASTMSTEQTGMHISVSPDRGDGSRMSYLSFADTADGITVVFYDVQGTSNPANFVGTQIAAGLSRSVPHTIKLTMDLLDGPSNDIVKVYIDGNLVHIGTSWENYYRYDTEASAEQSPRIIKTVLFRQSGTAHPANAGEGYLIDNLSLLSGASPAAPTETTVVVLPGDMATSFADVLGDPSKWFFYNDETDVIDNALGSFVTGPAVAPEGNGSAEISVSGTQRRNLATYQFSGTKLGDITEMKFSTYNPSAGNGGSATRSAYLNFNIDLDGSDTWQRRIAFVPSNNGAVTQDTWQEWDAIQGGSAMYSYSGSTWPTTTTGPDAGLVGVSGSTLRSWNDLLADYPGLRIRVTDSWLGMRVGEPYADGYTENLDRFVLATAAAKTIFDFDPTPGTIRGTVFEDTNANGVRNSGEPRLPGQTVFLDENGNEALDGGEVSTVTDGSGNYEFAGLAPDTYHVFVVVPADWKQTAPTPAGYVVDLDPGETASDRDFLLYHYGVVGGLVWQDQNDNGKKDPGEDGLPGWHVKLIYPDGSSMIGTTGADGRYEFPGLEPGTYTVRETHQSGWTQTTSNPGNITVESGTVSKAHNFGNQEWLGQIGGLVWQDQNANKKKDSGEDGLLGWHVRLFFPDGTYETGTTDANGRYLFTNLRPGTYQVQEIHQSGWTQTTPSPNDVVLQDANSVSKSNNFGNKHN